MSAHIIGRPNDDLLDIMLGHGADPEQAFISGSEQDPDSRRLRRGRRARLDPDLPSSSLAG